MKKIRPFLMWLWLLTKRLYKKPAFLALMIAVPLIIFAYGVGAQEERGMMTIALVCEDGADEYANALVNDLKNSSNIIRFVQQPNESKARQMVHDGVMDAAWIIEKDLGAQLSAYVSGTYTGRGLVTVVVRQETVPLMLTNEKLSAKLFVQSARVRFLQYFRENAPEMNDLQDDQVMAYFDGVTFEDSLFSFSYVDGATGEKSLDYLLMPVRGILAILVLICGMATAMFYISDEQSGLFSWISLHRKPYVELAYQLISLLNIAVIVFISICAADLSGGILREILALALYILCCACFCQLLRLWCAKLPVIAMILPVLIIAMLAICPIFFSMPELKIVQHLFPPTYYINAMFNSRYLLYMIFYSVALKALYELSRRILYRT